MATTYFFSVKTQKVNIAISGKVIDVFPITAESQRREK